MSKIYSKLYVKKFAIINLIISLLIFTIVNVFHSIDEIKGWSDILANGTPGGSMTLVILYLMHRSNVISITLKQLLYIFVFIVPYYTLILVLFCKEHLSFYVSEDLLRIIIFTIFVIGSVMLFLYVKHFMQKRKKEQCKMT
jgi:hypothetical protein